MDSSSEFSPAYLRLERRKLYDRALRAVASLAECRSCPRNCGVNRLRDRWSACKTGRFAVVSSCFQHFGEEDCLRGANGSGTIFFSHCNLRCVFCQNFDISQGVRPGRARGSEPQEIAGLMLELQRRGCHNINFVTPEHVVPQVIEALVEAVEGGLTIPIVYNTSAYDALESLDLLDGLVDIYMPDFKFQEGELTHKYCAEASDYPEVAAAAIKEMHRQVGVLRRDERGIAERGVILRHLVMPHNLAGTDRFVRWVAEELSPDTYVNIMDQYQPSHAGFNYPEIARPLTRAEWKQAVGWAKDSGLTNLDL